jgi:hypothetical protein
MAIAPCGLAIRSLLRGCRAANFPSNPREPLRFAATELFTPQLTCGTLEIGTYKLETIRARTPKALHGQNQPSTRMIRDGNNAAGQIVLLGPDVQ